MPKRGKVSSVVYINMYMFTAGKYALSNCNSCILLDREIAKDRCRLEYCMPGETLISFLFH